MRVVTIGFLAQFTAVLGAYFAVHNHDIPNFVRVYGSPRVVAGWPSFIQIGAYSRHSSMPTGLVEVEVTGDCGGVPVQSVLESPSSAQGPWTARFVVPEGCTQISWAIDGLRSMTVSPAESNTELHSTCVVAGGGCRCVFVANLGPPRRSGERPASNGVHAPSADVIDVSNSGECELPGGACVAFH